MEINELAAAAQKATGKERRALLLDLWERTKGILYLKARRFWSAHRNSCTARGVELPDVESIAWEVFTDAVNAWTPESGHNFGAFLDYPFRNRIAELLNIRTERGRREPLNYADSLNRPLDAEDSDGASLLDVVDDPDADFIDDLLDGLDAEQEAKAVREAVESLPEQLREVITRHYFDGQTLTEIAAAAGLSVTRVGQLRREALRKLRGNRRLQLVCADRIANDRAAKEINRVNARAATLLAVYTSAWAEAERLERAHEREELTAPEDSEEFTDGLAGILAEYLTTPKTA
ncbi:MAG: sigma-70 family RNA polymerase sigma factor [Oscillospiraceae bacterium]|nr:sigma-70 family RNA polymerase sigma factor [Oscillospiraceae bacterium]